MRREGKDGWYKNICHYSRTGWAWWNNQGELEGRFRGVCTCNPCKPPKHIPSWAKAAVKEVE